MDSEEILVLMRKFSETIEQDDINTIRKRLKHDYDLSNITSGEELFQKLLFNHSNFQSPLELLQNVVYLLGKKELLGLLIEFRDQRSTTVRSVDNEESFGEPLFPIKLQLKYVQPSDEHLKMLLKQLCELLALPYKEIIVDQTRHKEGSTVTVMVKEMYKDVLESMLQKDPLKTGLNVYGIDSVQIGLKSPYLISDTMVPVSKLTEYTKIAAALKIRMKKAKLDLKELEEKGKLLDCISAELGDPDRHLQQLGRLHKSAGLSTTVWKTVDKLSAEEELPQKYKPFMMQDELRQECLYSKARMMRLYPEQTWKKSTQTAAYAI